MPKVSIFNSVVETKNPEYQDLVEHLEDIRDGRWSDIVKKCRNIEDTNEQKEFKKTMPTVTLSGEFSTRRDDGLVEHNGYINIDLDHVENIIHLKRALENDRYTFAVWYSVTGKGLRVMFRIEKNKHREAFLGICEYIFQTYGEITADPNGINVSKPYIVSDDATLYINPDETPVFKKYIRETPIKKMSDFAHTSGDFEMVLKQITGRNINICEDYNDWVRVGCAIADQYGENGEAFFHDISRMSSKYKSSICTKQYKYCLRAKGSNRANISTVYYLAKMHGVNISSEQTKKIVRATRNGKKAGLKPEQIIKNLKEHESIEGADELVTKIFESKVEGESEEDESILHGLELFISNNYEIRMNEITGYLEQNGKQLTPGDLNTIFIAGKKLMPKLDYPLLVRLLKSDFIPTYNPFFEFFGSDGIPYELPAIPKENQNDDFKSPLIDKLSQTIINDDPSFTKTFVRKWIVSIISAAHKVHSPLLLCLIGAQNSGKTEWFRRLLPVELRMYYAESKLDKGKDDELLMTENILVMDDELSGKSKHESLRLNNITSQQWYSIRRPYGDHNEKILRLAVLCGTSNYYTILNDPTGNRRIIPVEVNDVDKELYNSIDKKDLFMEAFNLYKQGFDWRITKNDIPYLNIDQIKFETVIKEKELILKYYVPGDDERMSSTEIMVEIENLTRQKCNLSVIGRELKRLGFEQKTTRAGVSTIKKWMVTKVNRVDSPFDKKSTDDEIVGSNYTPF